MPTSTTHDDTVSYVNLERAARETSTFHWKPVFAGLFVSMIVYFALLSLGVGIGADQAMDVLQGSDSASALGKGVGVWFVLTVLISLFAGSYATSRVSGLITTRVGYTQGLVVAALFFTIMISQLGATVGMLGRGAAALTGAAGAAAKSAATNPQVNGIVEDALGDLNFRSPPEQVVSGFLSRLMRGNENSAVNYLSAQTGISREEAVARYQSLRNQVQTTTAEVAQKSAQAAKVAGWMSFALLLLGSISAMLGGGLGAQLNMRQPVDTLDRRALHRTPSYT